MARESRPVGPTKVESYSHGETRPNIPTADAAEEWFDESDAVLEPVVFERSPGFAEERASRNASLDPQLVWRGKDAQDATDLAVDAPPIYIQEKIDPRVLVENLRRTAAAGEPEPETLLFDGWDGGLDELERIEFYQHPMKWQNRMILGDSLQVMTSLSEREQLRGQVQMIYIDPPYGIKFGSNWQVSARKRDVKDGKLEDAAREAEQIKAFRDTWEDGIHTYLSYLRDRLVAARDLLTESGSVFVQIGDENVHLVRALLDEVFGADNYVSTVHFVKTSYATSDTIPALTDELLWYSRDLTNVKIRKAYQPRESGASDYASRDLASAGEGSTTFDYEFDGKIYRPARGRHWKTTREGLDRARMADRIFASTNSLRYKRFETDFPVSELTNVWTDTVVGSFHEERRYVALRS